MVQIYEDYWAYTAAWTDVYAPKFNAALKACIEYFDIHGIRPYSSKDYADFQEQLSRVAHLSGTSLRKGINQFVKIGFLKTEMQGYIPEAKEFINASTNKKKSHILSKVVYNYSNLQNAMTKPDYDTAAQIKFLINTLEEVGRLDKRALVSLMTVDINDYPKGYLTKEELSEQYNKVTDMSFVERKYNQISHLMSLLRDLDDLRIHDGGVYFKSDADRLFGSERINKELRDPYLQRIYKSELEDESCAHFGCEAPRCMLEGLGHPVLIASHIKPYSHCQSDALAQFDVNNGLLLSRNLDSLFDLGYMTFDDNGIIVPSRVLDSDMINYLSQYRLHKDFINAKRMEYMEYHRNHIFEKRYKSLSARKYVFQGNAV